IRNNQIRGTVYQSFDTSGLDAAPFSLNNHPSQKASYFQQRFGAALGGPLTIPKLYSGTRTLFFLNYTGNHSNNPYDAYSTVPTLAMRFGDLSGIGRPIIDPSTGLPFPGNQIPVSRQNPSSLALLNLIPTSNQAGALQNFHYVTTVSSQVDDINLRLVHNFGAATQRDQG